MAYELGRAYVQIIPSMRGALPTLKSELNGVASSSAFTGAGHKMGTTLATKAGKAMKAGLVAGAASTAGAVTVALSKGFKRLKAFEQAEQSMKGMGLSAGKIATVMANANKAVEGTAFGLDAAATAAKSLVTSGVEPGEKLQRVLSLIGDTAAQAGTDFNTMGLIWNKVFAKGRLQGDEAMQLMEAGIPVYQLVAEQLGITAQEAMKLGEKGKISAEVFANAMESRFAGSALAMGNTVTGSFQNVLAAMGRLGQGILAGPFADLPAFFTHVRNQINQITPTVTRVSGEVYAGAKAITLALYGSGNARSVAEAFGLGEAATRRVATSLAVVRSQIDQTGVQVRKSGQAIGETFRWIDQNASLGKTLDVLDRLVKLGGTLVRGSAQIADALAPIVSYGAQAAMILGGGVLESLEALAPAAVELGVAIANTGVSFSTLLVPTAQIASALLVPLANVTAKTAEALAALPTPVLGVVVAFASLKAGIGPLPTLLSGFNTAMSAGATLWARFSGEAVKAAAAAAGIGTSIKVPAQNFIGLGEAAHGASTKLGMLGKAGALLKANLPLVAISAVVAGLSKMAEASARNRQELSDLRSSFDEFGRATDNTRAKIVEMMRADENWAGFGKNLEDRLNDVGISTKTAVDAIVEGGPKLEKLKATLNELADQQKNMRGEPTRRAREIRDMGDALGKVAGEFSSAADAAKKNANATTDAAEASRREADAIAKVIDATERRQNQLLGVANKALAAREAQRAFNDAVTQATNVMNDGSASLDAKNAALDRVAEATQRAAVAARENGASQEELNAIIDGGKNKFFELATQAGMSADEVEALWKQIGLAPDVVETKIKINALQAWAELGELKIGIDETTGLVTIDGNPVPANTKLAQLKGAIDNGDGTVTINGNSYPADMSLETYLGKVATSYEYVTVDGDKLKAETALNDVLTAIRNGKEQVTIGGKDYEAKRVLGALMESVKRTEASVKIGAQIAPSFYSTLQSALSQIAQKQANIRIGGSRAAPSMSMQADGGIKYFANGAERHIAQIARPGEWRVWAEPETGGEAYIPLAVSKRQRSTEILAEVASQFGYRLSRFADGGLPTSGTTTPGVGPTIVNIHVDMNELASVRTVEDLLANIGRWSAQA
ncbi:tape measure protein [Trueperella pecoris]|uniref:Tape measure protein n=1 Tax=Trueperella pecoris TaxID=2733571 RepID=A0A7M1R067_9ACTO|nr:tape measure protein [Trueperella pecoris]QOR47578.1 tape measure protein [Trueperella pecoris]